MLPSILSQLGSDGLNQLKKLAASSTADPTVVDDDEVPELTTDFEETAVESLTQKVQEIPVAWRWRLGGQREILTNVLE